MTTKSYNIFGDFCENPVDEATFFQVDINLFGKKERRSKKPEEERKKPQPPPEVMKEELKEAKQCEKNDILHDDDSEECLF